MTSTLQQEAGRKLRFSSERTMSIAQRLYENGYITYMRTDSTTLSDSALQAARSQAAELYGNEYVHPSPRQYTRKVKMRRKRTKPFARRVRLSKLRANCIRHSITTNSVCTS